MSLPHSTITERTIMHEVWRQAYRNPQGLTIPCTTQADAIRLRFALYNSVKRFRKGIEAPDQQLQEAIATCSISFTEDRTGLLLQQKVASKLNEGLLKALAGTSLQSTEDYLMQDSFNRIMAASQQALTSDEPAAPPAVNPGVKYGAR